MFFTGRVRRSVTVLRPLPHPPRLRLRTLLRSGVKTTWARAWSIWRRATPTSATPSGTTPRGTTAGPEIMKDTTWSEAEDEDLYVSFFFFFFSDLKSLVSSHLFPLFCSFPEWEAEGGTGAIIKETTATETPPTWTHRCAPRRRSGTLSTPPRAGSTTWWVPVALQTPATLYVQICLYNFKPNSTH